MTIELPSQKTQTAFNVKRWTEILANPTLAKFEGRIETDRHGNAILHDLAPATHGAYQALAGFLLSDLMPNGRVSTECPISTADGVRAADVVWASRECLAHLGNRTVYPRCPEICIEVISPRNTRSEIEEKKQLYFDAGAREVWLCSQTGAITFFNPTGAIPNSILCPQFPKRIKLR